MKQTTNPAALVSRRLLAESLLRLMENESYKEITILQITQEAQVARQTFYRNFDSKEELLRYAIALFSEEFLASLLAKEEFVIHESFSLLLELCKEHRAFFQTLKENELLYLLLMEWSKLLPKIYESVGDRLRGFGKGLSNEELQLRLLFNTGGAFNVIVHWIEEGMHTSSEEMAAQLEHWLV